MTKLSQGRGSPFIWCGMEVGGQDGFRMTLAMWHNFSISAQLCLSKIRSFGFLPGKSLVNQTQMKKAKAGYLDSQDHQNCLDQKRMCSGTQIEMISVRVPASHNHLGPLPQKHLTTFYRF